MTPPTQFVAANQNLEILLLVIIMLSPYRFVRGAIYNITIRGLNAVQAARSKVSLDDVRAASDEPTVQKVIGALKTAETIVSHSKP